MQIEHIARIEETEKDKKEYEELWQENENKLRNEIFELRSNAAEANTKLHV